MNWYTEFMIAKADSWLDGVYHRHINGTSLNLLLQFMAIISTTLFIMWGISFVLELEKGDPATTLEDKVGCTKIDQVHGVC